MTRIKIILICLLASVHFISCDTEGDVIETGFSLLNVSFVYPSDADEIYRVTFNGQDAKNGSFYVPKNETNGNLEVYDNANENLVFSENITVEPNQNIQLIALDGEVGVFSEENYSTFTITFVPLDDSERNKYSFKVNGNTCVFDGVTANYMKLGQESYAVEILKDGQSIYSADDVTITPGGSLVILETYLETGEIGYQILTGNSDDNPPATPNVGKANFYFTKSYSFVNTDSIRVELYSYNADTFFFDGTSDGLEEVANFTIKAYQLSDYIEFDLTKYQDEGSTQATGYTYKVFDAKTEDLLFDGTIQWGSIYFETQSDPFAFMWKYQTMVIEYTGDWASIYTLIRGEGWENPTE